MEYKTKRAAKILIRIAFIYGLFSLVSGIDATLWTDGYKTSFVLISLTIALLTDGF